MTSHIATTKKGVCGGIPRAMNQKAIDLVIFTLQRTCSRSKDRPCASCSRHLRRDLEILLYGSKCPNATLCFMLYYVVFLNSKKLLPPQLIFPCQRQVIIVCTIIALKYLEEVNVKIYPYSMLFSIPVDVLVSIERLVLNLLQYKLDPGKAVIRAFMLKMSKFRERVVGQRPHTAPSIGLQQQYQSQHQLSSSMLSADNSSSASCSSSLMSSVPASFSISVNSEVGI